MVSSNNSRKNKEIGKKRLSLKYLKICFPKQSGEQTQVIAGIASRRVLF